VSLKTGGCEPLLSPTEVKQEVQTRRDERSTKNMSFHGVAMSSSPLGRSPNASCYPARWGKDPASQKTALMKLYEGMLRSYCSRRVATSLTRAAVNAQGCTFYEKSFNKRLPIIHPEPFWKLSKRQYFYKTLRRFRISNLLCNLLWESIL
jgi:hypothetical protein